MWWTSVSWQVVGSGTVLSIAPRFMGKLIVRIARSLVEPGSFTGRSRSGMLCHRTGTELGEKLGLRTFHRVAM